MNKNTIRDNKKIIGIMHYIPYLPIVLLFCVQPFIVYYKLYESRLSSFAWAPENPLATDFYLYYKQICFLILSGIAFLFTIFLSIQSKKNKSYIGLRKQRNMLIPLGIYTLFTVLSGIFSEYKYITFTGSDGQFESLWTLLGYLIFVIYFLLILNTERAFHVVSNCLVVLLALVALLGILQFTGNDPIHWEWFQKLITPKGYLETGHTVTSVFESNQVYLFAYNPNYAGVLLALLSGFCFGMLVTEKSTLKRILEIILLLGLVISLIGTGSKAGLLTCIVVVLIGFSFRLKVLWKYWYLVIPAITLVVEVLLLSINFSDLPIVDNIKAALTVEKQDPNPLEQMVTEKEHVDFKYKGVSFSVSFEYQEGMFDFRVIEDSKQIPIRLSENREVYYLEREGLEDVTIRPALIEDALPLFVITLNNQEWMFVKTRQEYQYLNQYLRLESLSDIERLGFYGYEEFASCRGLIWSMTLPLLKDTLLLGTGADTFACYYPQNNYKDLHYYNGEALASSRPHSMYLKTAVESGVISMMALFVFFICYLIQSVKIYRKAKFNSLSSRIGFSCFIAVTIYLICGLSNDSMITVAPVFWGILGIGMAANKVTTEN